MRLLFNSRILLAIFLIVASSASADVTNGPTLHLRDGSNSAITTPVADFMYFVPLISPDPVASVTSPGCTQSVRMISAKRHTLGHTFTTICEMELNGEGWQKSVFDLRQIIRNNERQLKKGESLKRRLKSIDVKGSGAITVEVDGAVSNDVSIINQVRLRFNPHGRTSPVWINLCDIRGTNDIFGPTNEIMARVNTLTFRRKAGPPTMEVTVASIKDKNAGNGFWQNVKGGVVGMAANLFIAPLKVEASGQKTMLEFGGALASDVTTFTFPPARNLRASVTP